MGKNVKLKNKRTEKKTPEKESFFFFVRDQGEGAARVVVIILKILELVMTTIFCVCLGIFGPLAIRGMDDPVVSSDPSSIYWLASSCVYIIGLFVLMFGHSKIATVIHVIAAAGTLVTYASYAKMFKDQDPSIGMGPTALYMPCLFITVMTAVIMLLINLPKWVDRHVQKVNEQAPSILGDREKK
ncbi:MAG: hypothetical protein K2N38_03590 [Oscillospiraceae bacterium]|nr:hypothetical protein [Oscillospiraceae bacterium]